MWSIDIVGPLPRSSSGHMFVLVICDYFTKFPLFFPLRKATAKSIVKIVEENVFLFFGAPQYILCDNGVQFRGPEFRDLANRYGSVIIFNPVYHPQANPAERTNRILKTMLISYVKEDYRKWDLHLSQFDCAIRTTRHEVTGFTPFFLNFGRKFKASGMLFGKTLKTKVVEPVPRQPGSLETTFQQVARKR